MSDDFIRVLSERTPPAEREAVILAEWRRHRAEKRRDVVMRALLALVVLFGCYLWFAYANVWPPLQ